MAVTITDEGYAEYQALKKADKMRHDELVEMFRVKSVCSHCECQSMDTQPDLGIMCDGTWCEGSMVLLPQPPATGDTQ